MQLFFEAHSFKSVKMSYFKVYNIQMYFKGFLNIYICILRKSLYSENQSTIFNKGQNIQFKNYTVTALISDCT